MHDNIYKLNVDKIIVFCQKKIENGDLNEINVEDLKVIFTLASNIRYLSNICRHLQIEIQQIKNQAVAIDSIKAAEVEIPESKVKEKSAAKKNR